IMATVTMSTKIPTVGIVTFTSSASKLKEAHIDFGLDTMYGMTAPVDLAEPSYRTLLLGMKASKMYHYRVVATDDGGGTCMSADATLMTGALANGLAKIKVTNNDKSKLFGGFLIMGQYVQNAGASGAPAYILDADGDYVWWYAPGGDVTGARMSHDGKHMWMNAANVPNSSAKVRRVTMDGMTVDDYSSQFSGQNHQMTVLPDGTIAFYAYGSSGCDDIKERSPSGTIKTIVNSGTVWGASGGCHVNTIQYSPMDDTLVFSDLDHQVDVKITRAGKLVWVLNGSSSTFKGDGWKGGEHGLHILGLDSFLIFNNNTAGGGVGASGGSGDGSMAIEMKLDLTAKTSKIVWMYKSNVQNDIMGDVQRLPNGNTVVGFSTQGVLDEVDANGKVLQELTWPAGASFGYIEKRATLYGPPPK
ncbi:MAG TPA: aryl-sulfate sulfotransferase, partial [Polyangia bacterium]